MLELNNTRVLFHAVQTELDDINCLIQRQFYGGRKKRFSCIVKENKHFNYHNFLNVLNTHLNLLTVNFLAI